MKKILFFLMTVVIVGCIHAQDVYDWKSNAKSIWMTTIVDMGYDVSSFQKEYPNFPSIADAIDNAAFIKQVQNWKNNNPSEVNKFIDSEEYKRFNFSLITLGLQTEEDLQNRFHNGWWEYITGSGISTERLAEIAPHFPVPNFDNEDLIQEAENYEIVFERWTRVFPNEYTNLVNAEELVAINPYYDGENIIADMPTYIKGLQSSSKPEKQNYIDESLFEEDLMAWYIVYDLDGFEAKFGFAPYIPHHVDIARHRTLVTRNVEFLEKESK